MKPQDRSFERHALEQRLSSLYSEGWPPRQAEGNRLMMDLAYLIDKSIVEAQTARARGGPVSDIEEDIVLCFMSAAVHVSIEQMGRKKASGWLRQAAGDIEERSNGNGPTPKGD